jgi:hypothetical protein
MIESGTTWPSHDLQKYMAILRDTHPPHLPRYCIEVALNCPMITLSPTTFLPIFDKQSFMVCSLVFQRTCEKTCPNMFPDTISSTRMSLSTCIVDVPFNSTWIYGLMEDELHCLKTPYFIFLIIYFYLFQLIIQRGFTMIVTCMQFDQSHLVYISLT